LGEAAAALQEDARMTDQLDAVGTLAVALGTPRIGSRRLLFLEP
jgi:hypothetical protein